jgi:hypothetical protein
MTLCPAAFNETLMCFKGRVSGMLLTIPIFAVTVDNLGERGAHRVAYQDFVNSMSQNVSNVTSTEGVKLCSGSKSSCSCTQSCSCSTNNPREMTEFGGNTSVWISRALYFGLGIVLGTVLRRVEFAKK